MPGKKVARLGHRPRVHSSGTRRKGHFKTVFANGIPVSGHGHMNTPHLKPCACPVCCCNHAVPLRATSKTVFCEAIPIGRVGDPTCTAVVQGSPNVFSG